MNPCSPVPLTETYFKIVEVYDRDDAIIRVLIILSELKKRFSLPSDFGERLIQIIETESLQKTGEASISELFYRTFATQLWTEFIQDLHSFESRPNFKAYLNYYLPHLERCSPSEGHLLAKCYLRHLPVNKLPVQAAEYFLRCAIVEGDAEMVEKLKEHASESALACAVDSYKEPTRHVPVGEVLHLLPPIGSGILRLKIVKLLLNGDGCSALHRACWQGKIRLCHLFLGRGADISVQDIGGLNPLHIAAKNNQIVLVNSLLMFAAEQCREAGLRALTAKTQAGTTPLQFRIYNEQFRLVHPDQSKIEMDEIAIGYLNRALLDDNVLSLAALLMVHPLEMDTLFDWKLEEWEGKSTILCVAVALNKPKEEWEGKSTILCVAVALNKPKIVHFLLENGANVEIAAPGFHNPLQTGSYNGRYDLVRTLLEAGADPDAVTQDEGKFTSALLATWSRHTAVVELLLSWVGTKSLEVKKARVHFVNSKKRHALSIASENGNSSLVTHLLTLGAQTEVADISGRVSLDFAAEKGHLEVCRTLLWAGANPVPADLEGITPLHTASAMGHLPVVELLAAKKMAKNYQGATPLMSAARNSHLDIVRYLSSLGGVNERDSRGRTAMHYAAGGADLLEALIQAGADPVAEDDSGHTPYDIAALCIRPQAMRALSRYIVREAEEPVDNRNKTALDRFNIIFDLVVECIKRGDGESKITFRYEDEWFNFGINVYNRHQGDVRAIVGELSETLQILDANGSKVPLETFKKVFQLVYRYTKRNREDSSSRDIDIPNGPFAKETKDGDKVIYETVSKK